MAYQSDITLTAIGLPTNKPTPAPLAATFVAATATSPESGNEFVDAFINNGRHYVNSNGGTQPVVIPYFFDVQTQTAAQAARGVNTPYSWRPFETSAYEKAVLGWEAVANVDLVRTTTAASALFVERLEDQATAGGTVSASHSLPSASASAKSQGNYNFEAVGIRQWTPDTLEPGGNFFRTFIHETGHGLGLKHPHDNGSGAFSPNLFPGLNPADPDAVQQRDTGPLGLNHMFGSVMSYDHGYEFDASGRIYEVETRQRPVADDYFLDHGFAATPMAYDIAAVQFMYGANMNYATGNNVYVLPDSNDPHPFVDGPPNEAGLPETIIYQPDTAFWACLWDAGGVDEIRYDGARNAILDLTAATLDSTVTGYGVLNYAAFIGGGYTIANGVVIENATGGSGDDSITGNQVANTLIGNAGNDVISGKGGADIMTGGIGADTFKDTVANLDSDTITDFGIADKIMVLGGVVTSASLNDDLLSFTVDGVAHILNVDGPNGVTSPIRITATEGGSLLQFASDLTQFGTVITSADTTGGSVYALYDAVFGRAPTALELEKAVERIGDGSTLGAVAQSLIASPEGQSHVGAADNATFVGQLYQTALDRVPVGGEDAPWIAALNGGASRGEIAGVFAVSGENLAGLATDYANGVFVADADTASVARLYYGLLDRAPDAGGLDGFADVVRAGRSLSSVAQDILNSAEFGGQPAQSNSDFVNSLYDHALGRPAEVNGAVGWEVALATGTSRADVAIGIAESQEAQFHLAAPIEGYFFVT